MSALNQLQFYELRTQVFDLETSSCIQRKPLLFSSNTGAEIMITSVYMCRQTDIHECVLMLSNGELLSQSGDDWLQRPTIILRTSITYLQWQLTVLIKINAWHTGVQDYLNIVFLFSATFFCLQFQIHFPFSLLVSLLILQRFLLSYP